MRSLGVWITALCAACGSGSVASVDGGADGGVGRPDSGAVADADTRCADHVYEDVAIPMRDGKTLAAFARHPADATCQLPTILVQTPYDKGNARALWFNDDSTENPLFASRDYNFVVLDWRGFFGSADALDGAPQRGEDGYDAVEWIADQRWSNGKVGTWGVSALCRAQHWTAVEQPPALVAAVPIFCAMNDTYLQYYPGGVLRREFVDTLGALFGGGVVEQHPTADALWSAVGNLYRAADVQIPMLIVAGWYDLDNNGTFETWRDLIANSAPAARGAHRLLIGDWHHFAAGGESGVGRPLTEQELEYFDRERHIQRDSLAWFDLHLRELDSAAGGWARVRYVRSGEGALVDGDAWPPAAPEQRALYLVEDGSLNAAAPNSGSVTIAYDPRNPSRSIGGQTLRFDLAHGPHDQADVLAHSEAAPFVSAPLAEPLQIAGVIAVELDVATTGADTDFAVRLTDVDANGDHLLIGEGIRRLKLRDSFSAVSAVAAGQRYTVRITLQNHLAYTFAAGHRVGLIVTSSNFPRFERNPNTGDDFYRDASAPAAVTNTLFTDGACRLLLPL